MGWKSSSADFRPPSSRSSRPGGKGERGIAKEQCCSIRLHFADLAGGEPGDRIFEAKLEGQTERRQLDLADEGWGANRPIVREFKGVEVQGGLKPECVRAKGQRLLAGIGRPIPEAMPAVMSATVPACIFSTTPPSCFAMREPTRSTSAAERGEPQAAGELLPLLYDELRRLAAHKLSLLPAGQTLQATALVHEAYLKLQGGGKELWQNRRHFFSAAAEAMRHILIDRARRRARLRHGAKAERVDLDKIEIPEPTKDEVLLLLNDALDELQSVSPERAEIVKLRFFAGFSERETAALLELSERSVQRHWSCAKAWLFERVEKMKAQ